MSTRPPVRALVLEPEGSVFTIALSDYADLRDAVGGLIDSVSHTEYPDLVGYIHDEGLLIGLEPNALASLIFGRPLVGPCVIVGCLSPTGAYDGENYDVPERYDVEVLSALASALVADEGVMESLRNAVASIDLMPSVTPLNDAQFAKWLETGELPDA